MLVYPVHDRNDFEQLYSTKEKAQAYCDERNARIEMAAEYYESDDFVDDDDCWKKFNELGGHDLGNKYFVGFPKEVL